MFDFKKFFAFLFLDFRHGKSCSNHDFSKLSKIWTTLLLYIATVWYNLKLCFDPRIPSYDSG